MEWVPVTHREKTPHRPPGNERGRVWGHFPTLKVSVSKVLPPC